ncbi:ABC transporter ATP-binding protein [Sulfuriferula sp. AH1]|uniref:ABC transporter ATP-binding protein n=1 Tax=Sulfuriferula sp. AH1 TaxID=1985873 RepID=UPI000B3B7265|nr:ABC transporter ATP-binding protein [Sulfuriferula sp. AH1]ARU31642.1 ABC transporter ATP-binding protein [Sulfuriferula sp. AH1]
MSDVLLRVEQLYTRLGKLRVVDGVSFNVNRQQTFAVLGESGCGKSMTALSIMRLLPEAARIQAGQVNFNGRDLLLLPESSMRDVRGGEIGMIFQEPMTSLNPVLTLGEQIMETLNRHRRMHKRGARDEAAALLQAVGLPDAARRLGEYPFQLSGGMKQRVMIAMTLAGNPSLLIADEPTTALDVTIQAQVLALLRRIQQQRGMGMLLITHDLGVVAEMADHVGVMYAGELVEIAPRDAFFDHPQHPYSRKLFAALPNRVQRDARLANIAGNVPAFDTEFVGCRFAGRCESAFSRCREEAPAWTQLADGHAARCHLLEMHSASQPVSVPEYAQPNAASGKIILSVTDLRVHFPLKGGLWGRHQKTVKAVDGVNLHILHGEALALVGESGCGKTTVGKAIVQLQPLTAGRIVLDGTDLGALNKRQLLQQRAHVQMIFQDPFSSLNPHLRVMDLLEEGMVALGVEQDAVRRSQTLVKLMDQVGLPGNALQRYPHEFSGGQRQRIAIARALAVRPKLIVCDEPTSALDVSVQAQIINLLKDLQAEFNLSLLFITHNLPVADYLAQRIAVMYLGRIVETGSSTEIITAPRHPYTQALLAAVPSMTRAVAGSVINSDVPSAIHPPGGCHFHPRCPLAIPVCLERYPEETRLGETHVVRCHAVAQSTQT